MNFDHVDPRLFWSMFALAWFAASWGVLWLFAKWVDSGNPRNRYVDRFDLPRCERAGSQGENQRRIRTAVGR